MAKLEKFVFNKVELPDNIYFARIKDIKLKVWDEENKSLNWSFEIVQPPYIGKKVLVWGSTTNIPTTKNRLTQFGSALGYSREQMVADTFDTDALVGSYVKVFLETTLKEDGTPKQHVTRLLALTEVDTQQLQLWLQQAQVTGPAKVAVVASAPTPVLQPVVVAQPALAPVVQPVVAQTVTQPTAVAPLAPKSKFPF